MCLFQSLIYLLQDVSSPFGNFKYQIILSSLRWHPGYLGAMVHRPLSIYRPASPKSQCRGAHSEGVMSLTTGAFDEGSVGGNAVASIPCAGAAGGAGATDTALVPS